MNLGMAVKRSLETNLVYLAKPLMDELRNELNETIALEIFSGANTILAYLAKGPYRTNLAGNVGDILAPHAAAGAKAILAFSSSRVRERILNVKLARLTPNTITDPEQLKKQFKDILRNGFSFDGEEHDIGTNAIGAPIFNSEGKPIAALVIAGPAQKIRPRKNSHLVELLKDTALKVSKSLYYNIHEGGK
jgi:DNA-binding IclR family transcriptional regulator